MRRHVNALVGEYINYEVERILDRGSISKRMVLEDFVYYLYLTKRNPWVIGELKGEDIKRFLKSRSPFTKRKPTIMLYIMRAITLKEFFDYLIRKGYAVRNPVVDDPRDVINPKSRRPESEIKKGSK